MKPRIFIGIHYLELGGAEISLIGLLQALDYEKVDVDLFVYSHQGELMKMIPEEVNLLPENRAYSVIDRPIKEALRRGYWRVVFARLRAKCRMKYFVKKEHPFDGSAIFGYVGQEVSKVLPDINPDLEYDLAISFLMPHNFVLDHVRAKKKICWIHSDYTRISVNAKLELPVWSAYDHVMSISHDVTTTFLQIFPSLESKIVEMENILSADFVRARAKEFEVKEDMLKNEGVILLSIGRFSNQKNFDNLPDICRRIIEQGVDVKWHIIGFGGEEDLIRRKIAEAGMGGKVVILGKKENPYPYIKACDVYVQPSRYEGKSVTVREAQMLCKPVVVTNYPTASSQINDGVDGVIVPLDNEECANGIVEFIRDMEKQRRIVEYLKEHDFGNVGEVEKIYEMLN